MDFIDLVAQYRFLKPKIDARVQQVLDHGQYVMGPEVSEFEEKLADFVGVKNVVSCANGTDALSLALMIYDVGPGDAVFCPSFTFFATGEVIASAGATPVFVDSDPRTFNMCAVDLKKKIKVTESDDKLRPRGVIAVDLFGLPANYPAIEPLCKEFDLFLIEDAAQGMGGNIDGKRAGAFGDIATTSFFPAKPLGCYGDGGAIFTDSDQVAETLRSLRVHGKGADKYDNVRIGMNSRLDTLQAAILIEKLEVFNSELESRNQLAAQYFDNISFDAQLPHIPAGYFSSWAQFTVISENRDALSAELETRGIPTAIYYRTCLHSQQAFCKLISSTDVKCPNAEKLAQTVLSLPMHPYMADCPL